MDSQDAESATVSQVQEPLVTADKGTPITIDTLFSNVIDSSANWIGLVVITLYFLLGCMISMVAFPTWDFWRALYFTTVTLSTVGYGDFYPVAKWHRAVQSFYIIFGLVVVAGMIGIQVGRLVGFHSSLEKPFRRMCNLSDEAYTMCSHALGFFVLFTTGVVFFAMNEPGVDFYQSFSHVTTTLTTVGYGDTSLTKKSSRIFLTFYIIFGVWYTAMCFSTVVAYFVKRERDRHFQRFEEMGEEEMKFVLRKRMKREKMFLQGAVSKDAFYIFCLIQMGRVSEDDIALLDGLYEVVSKADPEFFLPWVGTDAQVEEGNAAGAGAGEDAGKEE